MSEAIEIVGLIGAKELKKLWLLVLIVVSILAISTVPNGLAYPNAGIDYLDTVATVELQIPSLFISENITAAGPTVVGRQDPYNPGDDHFKINTTILSMDLSGMSIYVGPVTINVSTTKVSNGTIRQVYAWQDFPADSFFDVYVRIGVPAFNMTLHNDIATLMYAKIDSIPPYGANYTSQTPSVELYNETDYFIGNLKHVSHYVKGSPVGGFAVQFDKIGHAGAVIGINLAATIAITTCTSVMVRRVKHRREKQKM